MNTQPYEIIAGPLTLWAAPVGTAFPAIDAAPSGTWTKIGTNGTRNYSDDGVSVSHSHTFQKTRPAGATGPVKAFLDEEEQTVGVTLWDMTVEQYMYALNSNTLTTVAAASGTAGYKKIGMSHGPTPKEYALLARGVSPYFDAMNAQYEIPRCYQSGDAKPVFKRAIPAGILLEFTTLEDLAASTPAERFGRLMLQHQAPLA